MAKLYDLARMSTATTGTGTITLGAAVPGFLSFALASVQDGDVIDYAINDFGNPASEIGTGTYTAAGTTLTRTPTKSTNGNAAISLSGNAQVFICPRAETLNDASLFTTGELALARGGLGGDQFAATAGQVPIYPGLGGGALPTLPNAVLVTSFGAVCDGVTDDTAAIQAALNSGAGAVCIPLGKISAVATKVTVPANVALIGPGTIKRPVVALPATNTVALNSAVIPMTNTAGVVGGMLVGDITLGYMLPGTVLSVIVNTSVTMTVNVGNSGSHATNGVTASGAATLSFATMGDITAQLGMSAFNITQGVALPGTVLTGTPYSNTTIVMSQNVGGAGVASADVIAFGYPVTNADALVFGTYDGTLIEVSAGSRVSDGLILDMGNFASVNSSAVATIAGGAYFWIVDGITIINGGRYGFVYTKSNYYQITNNSFTINTPSNKNNNAAILSFLTATTPSGHGKIGGNIFNGAGIQLLDTETAIYENDVFNFKYGGGISCGSSAYAGLLTISGNKFHDSSGTDSNATTPSGIECYSPSTTIVGNSLYRNAGAGVALVASHSIVSSNLIYDNGQSVADSGIALLYQGPNQWENASNSTVVGNFSGNINGATQTYGYEETSSSLSGIIVDGSNQFVANATAATHILSATTQNPVFPAGRDTVVELTATQELTNKTLTSAVGKGTWTASGTWQLPPFTMGDGTGNKVLTLNGGDTNSGDGSALFFQTGGVTRFGFGNHSAIIGGAYSSLSSLYVTAGLEIFYTSQVALFNAGGTASASPTTGAFVLTGGLGVSADVFGGGKVVSIAPTAGIGYATGAGGTGTQSSSKSTTVTLSPSACICGQITMNNAALNAATIVSFALTDSAIAATDVIVANHISGGTLGAYTINARATGAGTAAFDVRNNTAGALSEAIVIQFAVIKAVNA